MPLQHTSSERRCAQCGDVLPPKSHGRRMFCGIACSAASRVPATPDLRGYSGGLVTGTRGAVSELRVVVDLMERGFHVYRAMSPSCPCDLVVWKEDGPVIRVEVKTARAHRRTGKVYFNKGAKNVFDAICHVTPDELIYEPKISEW